MRVVSSIINDFSTDQRVIKQTGILNDLGCDVTVVCRKRSPVRTGVINCRCIRFRFLVNKGPLFYFSYNLRLLLFLLFHRFDLYISNDLDTLLPCYIVSRLRRKRLVYDSHEYFTGQYGLAENRFAFNTWKWIERKILPNLSFVITVSDSIAELYNKEYGINPFVIRNAAFKSSDIIPVDRKEFGVSSDKLLVVLQGTGINVGRGASELLEALKIISGVHLLIIGSGDTMKEIKSKATDSSLSGKVTFIPGLPWSEMMAYTKACDAGLSLDKDTCLNQKYSLPNKLFDYLSAGIPVIVSPLPEISKIVNEFDCGIITDDVTPDSISAALVKLRDDKELYQRLKEGAQNASIILNWENESRKEDHFFRDVMETKN